MADTMTDAELDAFEKEVQEEDAILYARVKADKEKAEKERKALKKKNRFASLKNFFRSEKKVESREDKGMKAG